MVWKRRLEARRRWDILRELIKNRNFVGRFWVVKMESGVEDMEEDDRAGKDGSWCLDREDRINRVLNELELRTDSGEWESEGEWVTDEDEGSLEPIEDDGSSELDDEDDDEGGLRPNEDEGGSEPDD